MTIQNIQKVADNQYVGDDLPLMGRVTLQVVSPDLIEASVPGMLGPTRYSLTRVAGSTNERFDDPPMFATAEQPDEIDQAEWQAPASQPRQRFASLDEAFGPPRPLPQTFRGCAIPKNILSQTPQQDQAASPRDRLTGRQFAPVASPKETGSDQGDSCWTRLDGVWAENVEAVLDKSLSDGSEWDVDGTALVDLLHGNYTTPDTLFVVPGDDPEAEIWLVSAVNDMRFAQYVSDDGVRIEDLLGNPGQTKIYRAAEQSTYGNRLTLDHTAGGELRIRAGRRQFKRPARIKANDVSMDDIFTIQYQTDNFAASLKGYNVLTQDPFLLMNNPMGEVFARRERNEYRFQEKYAVPFGFTLKNELLQGNVYRQTMVSSESEIQTANTTTFGVNATISQSGAVNSVLSFMGPGQIADTGYSVGYSSSRETAESMKRSKTVAQVMGYSRAKSYAVLVEHADTKLSGDFKTAIADAKIEGNYTDLIKRFGTHYAYAVTYGASAKMWRDISSEAYSTSLTNSRGNRIEGEARLLGSSIGAFKEGVSSEMSGTSGEVGNEGGRFIAVGGNGSWDSGGYSRGDRFAPILLDLRPLDELLNPINFPNDPDVYTRVRTELAQSINRYLATQARPLSSDRLLENVDYIPPEPEKKPEVEQEQEWHVYIKSIDCIKAPFDGKFGVEGNASIRVTSGGAESSQKRRLEASCKRKSTTRSAYRYNARTQQEGLLILRGMPADIRDRNVRVTYEWDYVPGWKKTETKLDIPMRDYMSLSKGNHKEIKKKVSMKKNPDLSLQIRVRRVR